MSREHTTFTCRGTTGRALGRSIGRFENRPYSVILSGAERERARYPVILSEASFSERATLSF